MYGNEVYYPLRRRGLGLLIGPPEWGKSSLGKGLGVEASKYRPIIVFDYNSEWERHTRQYNPRSSRPMRLTNVTIYKDIVPKISDLTHAEDWFSTGMTSLGCKVMALVARKKEAHHDNPETVNRMLLDLPTTKKGIAKFREKYGVDLGMFIFKNVKINIIDHFNSIKSWFWFPNDTRRYYDWRHEFLHSHNMIIDTGAGFGRNASPARARMLTGYILSKFSDIYHLKMPVMIFEEGPEVFPNPGAGKEKPEEVPSSLLQGRKLVTLVPKAGVYTIILGQDEDMLDFRMRKKAFIKIVGPVDKGEGPVYKYARKLVWNPDTNYREAIFWQRGKFPPTKFVPAVPGCMV